MDVTVVTGNPAGSIEDDDTIDLAVGDTVLRLVSPRTSASRYAEVLGGREGRLHSFCLGVDDLDATVTAMPQHGISLTARSGPLAWTDPATTVGLALEWTQADR
jgi:hypothetical protein